MNVQALSHIDREEGHLFYPSAGRDVKEPIEAFSGLVQHYWFVDIAKRGDEVIADLGFAPTGTFELSGLTMHRREPFAVHVRSFERGAERVYLCRGRGYDALRCLRSAGIACRVFFYRGDSQGESGSGFRWLSSRLANVLAWIEPGGRLVTDGSMAHALIAAVCRSEAAPITIEISGYRITPVGELSPRYARTLVFRVDGRVPSP